MGVTSSKASNSITAQATLTDEHCFHLGKLLIYRLSIEKVGENTFQEPILATRKAPQFSLSRTAGSKGTFILKDVSAKNFHKYALISAGIFNTDQCSKMLL